MAHGSGPMWIATPSSPGTCTPFPLPVSRRPGSNRGRIATVRAASFETPGKSRAPQDEEVGAQPASAKPEHGGSRVFGPAIVVERARRNSPARSRRLIVKYYDFAIAREFRVQRQ